MFQFENRELSSTFNKYVDSSSWGFKLKKGYTLDTNISTVKDYNWTLRNLFNKNKDLIEYLRNLDFSKIITKKMELYGIENESQLDPRFSNKEMELIVHLN